MPSFQNDRAPADETAAERAAALSDAQFDKLVELLTPGYELSKYYLAQLQEQQKQLAEATAGLKGAATKGNA